MPTGHKGPPPNDSLRVAFEGELGPASWAVVHWFQLTSTGGPPSLTDLNELVDDIGEAYAAAFVHTNNFQTTLHLSTIKAAYRLQSGAGTVRTTRVADVSGMWAGDTSPAQVAYLINWQTIDDRRGGKARSYLPGTPPGQMQDDVRIKAAVATSLTDAANTYIATVLALSEGVLSAPQLVEMSFVTGGAYRATGVTFDIINGSASIETATQRRRVDRLR